MSYKPMAWQSVFPAPKKRRRSHEEVMAQQEKNHALAMEYKSASPNRRSEILQEYYDGNKYWVCSWPRWSHEHWAELTQIFVSYWHEAFMRYNPTTEKSVFNFFMDRLYKAAASQDYRRWIQKEALNSAYEFNRDEVDKHREGKARKEFFIHPQSDFDRAVLRTKLCRNLDTKEIDLLERHFFQNEKLVDIMKEDFKAKRNDYTVKQISQAAYNFKKRSYEELLDKLYLNVTKQELKDLVSQNDSDHPAKMETVYNTKCRQKRLKLVEENV